MRIILYLLQKEFIQIFRNRSIWPIVFILPIVQMLILVNAATRELKRVDLCIIDHDGSEASRRLTGKFESSPFFRLVGSDMKSGTEDELLLTSQADVVLTIPNDFEADLRRENEGDIQVFIDAINGSAAELIYSYANAVISGFNNQIRSEWLGVAELRPPGQIKMSSSFWYNPSLIFSHYMAPGVLVILITITGMSLASVNLVREKEVGTMEQLNVTPIQKYQFIIAKTLPFLFIALVELTFGLAIATLVFDLPFRGNLGVLYVFSSIFLLSVMGLGMLISVVSETQQQVFLVSYFFLIIFILMSGLFTPVESMPHWAQQLNLLNPLYYMMRVIRNIILKGSGFIDLIFELVSLSIFGVTMFALAVWRYKKTV